MPKLLSETDQRITLQMARDGYTLQEIADHFGVTREAIRMRLARMDFVPEQPALRRKERSVYDAIIQYKRGHDGVAPSVRDIAKITNLSTPTVIRALNRLHEKNYIVRRRGPRDIQVIGGKWRMA